MSALPDPSLPWPIPMSAVALIAEAEGCALAAYRCPAGVPTLAWGRTAGVHMGDICTREQADRWLCDEVTSTAQAVRAMCTVAPGSNELGALTSMAYNVGAEALRTSSVMRAHNAGDHAAAARAFALWDKARVNGTLTVLPGLTARRAAEAALYLTPESGALPQRMPQAVAPEPSLAASPTVQVAGVGGALGALDLVSALQDTAGAADQTRGWLTTLKGFAADTLGLPADWVLPAVLLTVCAVVLYRRWGQRRQGVA